MVQRISHLKLSNISAEGFMPRGITEMKRVGSLWLAGLLAFGPSLGLAQDMKAAQKGKRPAAAPKAKSLTEEQQVIRNRKLGDYLVVNEIVSADQLLQALDSDRDILGDFPCGGLGIEGAEDIE